MSIDPRLQLRLNSIVQIILLLVMAGLLAWSSTRWTYEVDWTQNGRNSLSQTSVEVLSKLEDTLEITAYAREQQVIRDAIRKFVGRYQYIKPDIVLRFVNPDAVPDEVRSMGINTNGELVLRYNQRTQHVRSASEQQFTNALQRLLRGSDRWLAFVEGHGERDPLGKANHDLALWTQQLQQRGFHIHALNLSDTQTVPDNTSVLIIAGPAVSFLQGETELILSYLNRGGNLLWLQDPGKLYGLETLADFLGIAFPQGTIVDAAGQLIGINDPSIALVTNRLYGKHPSLEQLDLTTLFPTSTAIASIANNKWQPQILLSTGDHTWQETGELKGEVVLDNGSDLPGPLPIGLSMEREVKSDNKPKQQRIIVVGDGDFLSNTYVGNSGNMELGLRLINWLSNDDELINIPSSTAIDAQFEMNATVAGSLGLFFIMLLPASLFATGLVIWWRRRKL